LRDDWFHPHDLEVAMIGIRVIRALSAAAVVAALGFGGTQVAAKPAPFKDRRIICPFGQQPCSCPGIEYCTFTEPCACG
jgi:hypothetical protein